MSAFWGTARVGRRIGVLGCMMLAVPLAALAQPAGQAQGAAVVPLAQAQGGTVVPLAQTGASAAATNPAAASPGAVQELQTLIKQHELSELRTTYNGKYGASLLFHPGTLTYYVALFHDGQFWRVAKMTDAARSEALYRDFVEQTVKLSQVEIRRILLDAQNAHIAQLVAANETRLAGLQTDLSIQRQQEAALAQNHQEIAEQAAALDAERNAAQARLTKVQRQIRLLERQQDSADLKAVQDIQQHKSYAASKKEPKRRVVPE